MNTSSRAAKDRFGKTVSVGSFVRLRPLRGKWFDELPENERREINAMVGQVFRVEEIDEYGRPWILKMWQDGEDTYTGHDIALDADEMELVDDPRAL